MEWFFFLFYPNTHYLRRLGVICCWFSPFVTYHSQVFCAITCYAFWFLEKKLKQTSSKHAWPQEHKQPIKHTHTNPHMHAHIINSYLWGTWEKMAGTIKPKWRKKDKTEMKKWQSFILFMFLITWTLLVVSKLDLMF